MRIFLTLSFLSGLALAAYGQSGTIAGVVRAEGEALPYATVQIVGTNSGTSADAEGNFKVENVPVGVKTIQVRSVGYRPSQQKVTVQADVTVTVEVTLQEDKFNLNEVVVTGTRTAKRKTDSPVIVNLASQEYAGAVDRSRLRARVVDCVFEDRKAGRWQVIGIHAKRARGAMARWAVQQRVARPGELAGFDVDGYAFDAAVSAPERLVFRRAAA